MSARRQRRRLRRRARALRLRAVFSRHFSELARARVRHRYGEVIGITGSVGKSSSQAAVAHVLRSTFTVPDAVPNYNTRTGLLLSIFGQREGGRSSRRWTSAIAGAARHAVLDRSVYDKLVLEMAVGRPGDMAATLKVFHPDIVIFTGVSPAHLGGVAFSDVDAIFQEKAKIVRTMRRGTAILMRDNAYVARLADEDLRVDRLWYGRVTENQPFDTLPPGLYYDRPSSSPSGIVARVRLVWPDRMSAHVPGSPVHRQNIRRTSKATHGRTYELTCPVLGEHHLYVLLPALLTGLAAGIGLEEGCRALRTFSLPPGRMSPIPGRCASTIIDSSFNSSPVAAQAALETLGRFPAERRIALLGSMNELGCRSEAEHRALGGRVPQHADLLVTVGTDARWIADAARQHGMEAARTVSFDTAEEAGSHLRDTVRAGDAILVKGSRHGIHLERAIRFFMRDPDQAGRLLVA